MMVHDGTITMSPPHFAIFGGRWGGGVFRTPKHHQLQHSQPYLLQHWHSDGRHLLAAELHFSLSIIWARQHLPRNMGDIMLKRTNTKGWQFGLVVDDVTQWNYDLDQPKDPSRNTLLHLAVLEGSAEAVDALLAAGANPFLRNADYLSPLDLAEVDGKQIIVHIIRKWIYFIDCSLSISFLQGKCPLYTTSTSVYSNIGGRIRSAHGNSPVPLYTNYLTSSLVVYEDYLDWTYSTRKFYLQELHERYLTEERESWDRLERYEELIDDRETQMGEFDSTLSRLEFSLSSKLFDQEARIRSLREGILCVTEKISSLRGLLGEMGRGQ
ncbi:ankyrin repeat domain-containing protein, partial [archaeon]